MALYQKSMRIERRKESVFAYYNNNSGADWSKMENKQKKGAEGEPVSMNVRRRPERTE